jgi:light-regulated signal transduction histidine kinase (bacteriophytochrome)
MEAETKGSTYNVITVRVSQEEWVALEEMLEERRRSSRKLHDTAFPLNDDLGIWIRVTAPPTADSAEELIDSLATIFTIGERKRMQEEIEIMHTNLASRACELEIANHELEAFSSAVSHDLRLPMTIISGYCQLILDHLGDDFGEECKGYLRQIHDETIRANQLIGTLLGFSRLSHRAVFSESVDLGAMVNEIVAGLRSAQPHRRVQVNSAAGMTVKGDPSLLRVAMANLLGNAWKYTARKEEGLIEVGTTESTGKPVYFVRDNGVGFDMAHADRLFGAFQRLHRRNEFDGIGIGLSIVRRIIQRHGGEIWAEGVVGEGATFFFVLGS